MKQKTLTTQSLPTYITKSASKQTYYTFLLLADRDRLTDAYRSYAYFRWVDDVLDAKEGSISKKCAFIHRQKYVLEACYRGEVPYILCAEEWMLVDLVCNNPEVNSGLHTYLHNMMEVMSFDAGRRSKVITQAELTEYSRLLATAVTEVLYYYISRDDPPPHNEARYLSVTAAHITHMLRDTLEDTKIGYFNIPLEYLQTHRITPRDLRSLEYQEWVRQRVQLAKEYFKAGREYLSQVENQRIRLVCYAYTARFEWVLRAIEHDNYRLHPEYPERKGLRAGLWMGLSTLAAVFASSKD